VIERVIRLLLLVGLFLSIVVALAYSVRVFVALIGRTDWYWGGAVGAYAGPLLMAGAMYLNELRLRAAKQTGEVR
jgi:hypothetical protein